MEDAIPPSVLPDGVSFTCDAEALAAALDRATIVAPPVLKIDGTAGVLFAVGDLHCTIWSRDRARVSSATLPIAEVVGGPAAFVYPGKHLAGIKHLRGMLHVSARAGEKPAVVYTNGRTRVEHATVPPTLMTSGENELGASRLITEISAAVLRRALMTVRVALPSATNRTVDARHKAIVLRGDASGSKGCVVAADGVRAIRVDSEAFAPFEHLAIASEHVGVLLDFLRVAGGSVQVRATDTSILLTANHNTLGISKLAAPPTLRISDYTEERDDVVVRLPKSELERTLKHLRAELAANYERVVLRLDADGKTMSLEARSPLGQAIAAPIELEIVRARRAQTTQAFHLGHLIDLVCEQVAPVVELRFAFMTQPSQESTLLRTFEQLMVDADGIVREAASGLRLTELTVTRLLPARITSAATTIATDVKK